MGTVSADTASTAPDAESFFGHAVYYGVVVDLRRGNGGEHRRGNLVGDVVAVDLRHDIGEGGRRFVGNGVLVYAACCKLFRYEAGEFLRIDILLRVGGGKLVICVLFGKAFCNAS